MRETYKFVGKEIANPSDTGNDHHHRHLLRPDGLQVPETEEERKHGDE
jgi:hypothetical protein